MITNQQQLDEHIAKQSFLDDRIRKICSIIVFHDGTISLSAGGGKYDVNDEGKIVKVKYDNWSVDKWEFDEGGKSLSVVLYESWAYGGQDWHDVGFSSEYIWMPDEEIVAIEKDKEQKRLERVERARIVQEQVDAQKREHRDLLEFERLKAKLGK